MQPDPNSADPAKRDYTKRILYEAVATPATITIEDNDTAGATHTVTVSAPAKVYEGQDAVFTFTATPALTGEDEIVVNYVITKTGAILADSVALTDTINIDADGPAKLPLPTTSDATAEEDGSVTLEVLAYTSGGTLSYNVGAKTPGTNDPDYVASAELIDDDVNDNSLPSVTIAVVDNQDGTDDSTITEDATSGKVTFNLSASTTTPPGNPTVTVQVMVTQEGDFLQSVPSNAQPVTITKGDSQPLSFDLVNDDFDEDNGKVTAMILPDTGNTPIYAVGAANRAVVTINDDDEPLVFSITRSGSTERTASTVEGHVGDINILEFDVTLSRASTRNIQVHYDVGLDTDSATLNEDYMVRTIVATGIMNFNTGQSLTQTITIDIIEDAINEADESFTITLSNPSVADASFVSGGETETVTGTITNDDNTLPVISIVDAEGVEEGTDENGVEIDGKITFTLSLLDTDGNPVAAGQDIMVRFVTSSPGDLRARAEPTADYTVVDQVVTITKGTMSKEVVVVTKKDEISTAPESDEKFIVTLSNPQHATLSGGGSDLTATGTILSNDKPVFEIASVTQKEGDTNNNMVFVVTLSSGATEEFSVKYATSDGTATAGTDYTATSDTLTFPVGTKSQNIEVPILGDTDYEPDKTFTVTLSFDSPAPTGVEILSGGASATGTIQNDDNPAISVAATNPSVNEGEPVQFTFTANETLLEDLTINITLTETGGSNFLTTDPATETSITFPAGATHSESYTTKVDDTDFGANSLVTLTIESGRDYIKGTASAAVVVFDQSTPTDGISVIALTDSITEDADNNSIVEFQIKSPQSSTATSARVVNISVDQGNANFLDSASSSVSTVTIPQDAYTVNLPLTIEGDDVFEAHGEIEVSILESDSGSATYSVAATHNSASIAVFDDDFDDTELADSVGIVAAKATVSEAETASFQVIAKTTNTDTRTISVRVTEVGDFISGTTYDNPVDVTIAGGKLFGSLDIALDDDRKYETNGSITATIVAEDLTGGGTATYSLASASSATIAVTNNDDDLPIITISSNATTYGVTEGGSFEFTVTSDRTISGTPLVVNLTPGYTGGAVNPGAAIAGNSVSIPIDGTTNTGTVTMVSGFEIG